MSVGLLGQQPERCAIVRAVCLQQRHEHRVVPGLAGREQDRDRNAVFVGQGMDLRRPAAAGAAQCVISWLAGQILVIRPSPLCGSRTRGNENRRRASGHGCWSNRSTTAPQPQHHRRPYRHPPRRTSPHRSRPATSAGADPTPTATPRTAQADHVTANRSGTPEHVATATGHTGPRSSRQRDQRTRFSASA